MKENYAIWRPIKNYPDYLISNLGDVSSERFNKRIRLKPGKNSQGYYVVVLTKNKIRKTLRVHRLVAEAFIENKFNKLTVNHLDANKLNNNITNLQWVTQKQNIQHAWKNFLCENVRKAVKKNIIKAYEVRKKPIYSKDLDLKFESLTEAATYLKTHYFENSKLEYLQTGISKLLNNKIVKSKYDFSWEYVNK